VIYGTRVRQARLFLGATQTQFAGMIGMSQAGLSGLENETKPTITDDAFLAIAEHTGFPPEFFERPSCGSIDDVQFRARLTFKAADRNQAMSCANLVHETYALMREQVEVPAVGMRPAPGDPRETAREFRALLGLPSGPVANLTTPVERIGVALITLPVGGKKHDAFSAWQPDSRGPYPLIVTFAGTPGDRLRWNIAHELGHLLLHRGGSGQEIEREADVFAAELLTPMKAMAAEIPARPRLASLYAMKMRWGVSVQSLIRRAREAGRVTDEQYTSLFRQVSARGERISERYQVPREKPRIYRKMAEVLFGESPAPGLSALGGWTEEFAQDVLAQFASKSEMPARRVWISQQEARSNVVELRPGERKAKRL
jgi:Zn-dependent peptidase ImmA (M78 family)/transcriptional regulator with XRE-family HTH domain